MNYKNHEMEVITFELEVFVDCAVSKGDGESVWSIKPDRSDS